MNNSQFDLIVIGSGPAGQKGAICAAKMRKRVAVIDRTLMIGGVCVHTGTIPSKSVREAIFQLTGNAVRAFYGESYRGKNDITVPELSFRVKAIVSRETDVIRSQLKRNGVSVFQGTAQFVDPHTLEVQGDTEKITVRGDHILIACGTRPARDPQIPFDDKRIVDTDSISCMEGLPREIIVVGAGVV
ncbi:MAG: FAD-dependent oxidoreductase, partial [Candidatus Acidiferrales bacterium]